MQKLFDERFIGELFGEEGVDALRRTIALQGTPDRYLRLQGPHLVTTRLGRLAVGLAQTVEPIDRTLGSDEESQMFTEAFRDGALLAIGGLQRLVGNDRIRKMLKIVPGLPRTNIDDDELGRAHYDGQTVLGWGLQGYALADAYHDWLEGVEDKIAAVRHQIAAKSGFGMLFYLIALARDAEAVEAITSALATLEAREGSGEDPWDEALNALLTSESQ